MIVLAGHGDRLLFVGGFQGRDQITQMLGKARLQHPQGGKSIEQLAVGVQEWIGDPAHRDRVTGVQQRIEPALETVGDHHGVAALEGGDQELGDVAQA